MNTASLIEIFDRDLNKLITEINLYKDEERLWIIKDGIGNSAGNLCLHLIGNLNHFIGAILGNTGYVREREKEFSLKNIPRKNLVQSIENTITVVRESLSKLSAADFEKLFPLEVFGKPLTTGFMLLHLTTHLAYHLGQINYHRRLLA
ncbi:DinB family protein [Ferruginibacter sp.]